MNWQTNIEAFCNFYNIPLEHLADTLNEPKVIPMIRGKAFEFSVLLALQTLLPKDEFTVSKTPMNAQIGFHDEDVTVHHNPSGVDINVECKLAGKGTFRRLKQAEKYRIRVKCMRSRTIGATVAHRLAEKTGIEKDVLLAHADSYLPTDFDVVITSIGNTFYKTNPDTGRFQWQPDEEESSFLSQLQGDDKRLSLKDFAFYTLYAAPSIQLAATPDNNLRCTRRKCKTPDSCGFIPNYPIITYDTKTVQVDAPWIHINNTAAMFRTLAYEKARSPNKEG